MRQTICAVALIGVVVSLTHDVTAKEKQKKRVKANGVVALLYKPTNTRPQKTKLPPKKTPLKFQVIRPKKSVLSVKRKKGQTWDAYFKDFSRTGSLKPRIRRLHAKQVRATVRHLMAKANRLIKSQQQDQLKAQLGQVVDLVRAALRHGHPQPWMYEAMSLAMLARGDPLGDVDRALMSAVDFSESVDTTIRIANYMSRVGLDRRALKVFRQVSVLHPYRPEPFLQALAIAQRIGDHAAMRWPCIGILSQEWPRKQQHIRDRADRLARTILKDMNNDGRRAEYKEFRAAYHQATIRDIVVIVRWSGDADIDLMVKEPSGTICSMRSQRTTGGGVLLGDSDAPKATNSKEHLEVYVCPQGFQGDYHVFLRRIWGKVTTGKATVEIYLNRGTKHLRRLIKHVRLSKGGFLGHFHLAKGRRVLPLQNDIVTNLQGLQQKVHRAFLAQQLASQEDVGAVNAFYRSAIRLPNRRDVVTLFNLRRRLGFRPMMKTFDDRRLLRAIISNDGRFVRISGTPFFGRIGDVSTFNFSFGDRWGLMDDDDDDQERR